MTTILEQSHEKLRDLVMERGLMNTPLQVFAKPLTPEEAIGAPGRRDFPIIVGKERVIEAVFLGARGQAFTDTAKEFTGTLRQIMDIPLASNGNRALFVATLNAVMRHLDQAEGTIHCKDDDPEVCGPSIAKHLRETGAHSVGLVGLNPAIAEALVKEFGCEFVSITDLNRANIGTRKFGVQILDGRTQACEMIRNCDALLMTGSTIVNDTFDELWDCAQRVGKPAFVFGVTAAGICKLMNLPRLCPCARN